jgi:uncharacterized protein YjbI with pentapeptide repeats
LTGTYLYGNFAGGNFAGQNLTNADFSSSKLIDADFTGADVRGASFNTYLDYNTSTYIGGLTLEQLYSTASYRAKDLTGVGLSGHNLAGGNFAGQNLTNANFTGATLAGADFTDAEVRGATLYGVTLEQLYSTASYRTQDLTGIELYGDLAGANFVGQKLNNAFLSATLTGADFRNANLANAYLSSWLDGADFTDAVVRGATLSGRIHWYDWYTGAYVGGISSEQLYSTASFQAHDLGAINLSFKDLSGWNFAGQNLTNAQFGRTYAGVWYCIGDFCYPEVDSYYSTLTSADFTAADTRGAQHLEYLDYFGATTANLIQPNGHITGLDLDAGKLLVVGDYDGDPTRTDPIYGTPTPLSPIPITIDQHLVMATGATLQMVFEADAWDSTISFAPGIPVTLGGTLELTFANDVNLPSQLGRTFDLFDWTGVTPTGAFAISSPYAWDLSNLYTTGEIRLTAVPEPSAIALAAAALGVLILRRGRYFCND